MSQRLITRLHRLRAKTAEQIHCMTRCSVERHMLWKERGINWNDFPVDCKRGSACYKTKVKETAPLLNDKGDTEMVEVVRNRWVIDREPPIFSQERGYVEKWI